MRRLVGSRGWLGAAVIAAAGLLGCGEAPKPVDAPSAPPGPATASVPDVARPTPADDRFPSTAAPTGPEAVADAQRRGSPLVVFFAPADDADRADRSRVVDLLLQPDAEVARAPLVLAHVVALGAADLDAVVPGASASAPFAVVVETDGRGASTQAIPWPAALAGEPGLVSFDVQRRERDGDAPAADRAFWDLARALRSALVGDAATRARRAAQRAAAGAPDAELFGPDAEETRRRRSEALDDAWRARPIPGTRWVPVPRVELSDGARRTDWCGTAGPSPGDGPWPVADDGVLFPDPDDGGPIRVRVGPLPPAPRRDGASPRPPVVVDAGPGGARLELLAPRR